MYEVLQFIRGNLDRRLSADEVAHRFGYSKWHFLRRFRQYTGKTFVEYIRHHRCCHAAIDILNGCKIIEIAGKYGYDTPSGFNKAFKREFGCLPLEYRRRSGRKDDTMTYPLPMRCVSLRDAAMNAPGLGPISAQCPYWYSKGAAECPSDDPMLATGEAIASVIENAFPRILPDELLVGYNFSDKTDSCWGTEELIRDWMPEKLDEYIQNRKIGAAKQNCRIPPVYSEQQTMMQTEWAMIGRCIADNHSVIGYEQVLKLGFSGLLEKIDRYEAQNGPCTLYTAARRVALAACGYGETYAREAERLMNEPDTSDVRRKELAVIARTCRQVPAHPARSFREALQSLLFAHIINTWEDSINANSLGRLDQILYPYYKADLDAGIITREEAFELICCLWIKLYRSYDVQQSCVGGCTADGKSAVNDLSWLMLDATEALGFIRCLSVRYGSYTERAFLQRALEVVAHVGKGVPFFFNDDVMIPALINGGIAPEDAWDYTQIGCVETVIPGKSNPHAVTGETNLLKGLEYALANGHSMMHPDWQPALSTGKPETFTSYEALKSAVFRQIEYIIDSCCQAVVSHTKGCENRAVKPVKSLLTEGCIERGLDFNNHGALYDYYHIMLGGIPNLADSLAALKKFVYDEGKYTLAEVVEQLANDWPDEPMRLEFKNKAPKFGNDIEAVDSIAASIMTYACDVLDACSEKYSYNFHAQPFTFLWMIDHGRESAASPDGRHAGEIIAYSVSPMQGRDREGLTALFKSLCCFPTKRTPGTTSAIVEVSADLMSDDNLGFFTDLMQVAGSLGLSNVQFNVASAQTLMDAQAHPEQYPNLAVRVSGFSQKFNLLSRELQDHIIARTKHAAM
ncbi:MAG: helix-turn-helix domain-containing protein [Clostridia bacterium]|nr:helix-turn-helix domain-containing protein [Clostridia bacterium]